MKRRCPKFAGRSAKKAATRGSGSFCKAQGVQVGKVELTPAKALTVAGPRGAGFVDMAERVGARVAEKFGIGRTAYSHRIEDEEKGPCHG